MLRPPRKLAAQVKGNIRHCSQQIWKPGNAWQAHFACKQSRMRSRTSIFQKKRFSQRRNTVFTALLALTRLLTISQLISQGGIIQHELMGTENLTQPGIDFLFHPRSQGGEIIR